MFKFISIFAILLASSVSHAAFFQGEGADFEITGEGRYCGTGNTDITIKFKDRLVYETDEGRCDKIRVFREVSNRIYQATLGGDQVFYDTEKSLPNAIVVVNSKIARPELMKLKVEINKLKSRVKKLEQQ